MQTEILSEKEIERAKELMLQGEPVAFPTETVYGLGAPLFLETAVKKIFSLKNRPADNPLIVHVNTYDELKRLVSYLPPSFFPLYENFCPGPLTFVLPRARDIPSYVSSLPTIAVRFPENRIAKKLIEALNQPIVAPSANLSGSPSSTTASHVLADFSGKLAAVIDGGTCPIGIESTVILLNDKPTLLRPGAISKEEIEDVLKTSVEIAQSPSLLSPGMRYRHYAPKAKITIFYQENEMACYLENNKKSSRFIMGSSKAFNSDFCLTKEKLYELFRLADKEEKEEIVVFCSVDACKDLALMNRLLKAASKEAVLT